MCGIAGYYASDSFVTEEEMRLMAESMKHRGPDAEGFYCDSHAGFAHKRLSILDLSDNANQPMESHSRRYTCVYNGEIYNFRDIAAELDVTFRTRSDTEIIIEAFEEWGVTFVNKLNGMFALAIYDKQEKVLYLFRDRVGIKPLFYYWDGDHFVFASELKALLQVNNIKQNLTINSLAVNEYLHLGFIPEPNTIYRKIRKFPSGHLGILDENGLRIEAYWMIEGAIRRNLIDHYKDAKSRLTELIDDSVESRLISDVPFGSLLSGGIDSSLVTAFAQKHTKGKLNTFSIGFKENEYNEAEYARKVAQHLGTNHHEHIVSKDEARDIIPDILDYYDEPYADSSAIPTMLLSKFAKKDVSVVLSGDGGDELFHGYGAYIWAKRLSNPLLRGMRQPIKYGLSKMSNRHQRVSHLFDFDQKAKLKSHIFSQEQYFFSKTEIEKILVNNFTEEINLQEDHSYFVRNLSAGENQAVFDLRYYLKDDLLVKLDRASMRYSLEARVPLLDHRIVEFALNLDPKLKVHRNTKKYLLKEILFQHVPASLFDRPKSGFALPLKEWLRDEHSYLIKDYLSKDVIEKHNVINYPPVKEMIDNYMNGTDYLYNRLWLLIVLHQFLERMNK
ncbi:MAG: asparagine synthase (glutamine-hydrolyzing) [Candidatus Delongbacteria bacterium]|nr:asparagine synthase (glutamine-hydrolyzing) [Candidatus Delongbacteria bacterium]